MGRLHDDEIDVDEDLVRRLVGTLRSGASAPPYAGLPVRRFEDTGSTNALFRLGEELLVRLPRQPGGTQTIEKEQRWLPYVAPHLPVGVPEVVAVGEPGFGYPEKWSVVRFQHGVRPEPPAPGEAPRHRLAEQLAQVVDALGTLAVPVAATSDPGLSWYRGRPLAELDQSMREFLHGGRSLLGDPALDLDLDAVETAWDHVLRIPEAHREVTPRWYHGDLNAENLLVRDGGLAAVLDFGGLSVGDPTVDLVVAWQLLDPAARATFRQALGVDDVTWHLARGWVLVLSVMGLPYYWVTMRDRCLRGLAMGRQALAELTGR